MYLINVQRITGDKYFSLASAHVLKACFHFYSQFITFNNLNRTNFLHSFHFQPNKTRVN